MEVGCIILSLLLECLLVLLAVLVFLALLVIIIPFRLRAVARVDDDQTRALASVWWAFGAVAVTVRGLGFLNASCCVDSRWGAILGISLNWMEARSFSAEKNDRGYPTAAQASGANA